GPAACAGDPEAEGGAGRPRLSVMRRDVRCSPGFAGVLFQAMPGARATRQDANVELCRMWSGYPDKPARPCQDMLTAVPETQLEQAKSGKGGRLRPSRGAPTRLTRKQARRRYAARRAGNMQICISRRGRVRARGGTR